MHDVLDAQWQLDNMRDGEGILRQLLHVQVVYIPHTPPGDDF